MAIAKVANEVQIQSPKEPTRLYRGNYDLGRFGLMDENGNIIARITDYISSVSLSEYLGSEKAPVPMFHDGVHDCYTEDQAKEIFEAVKIGAWLKAENRHNELAEGVVKKYEIIELLKKTVSDIERLNARSYARNRNNSIQDAKRRAYSINPLITFVTQLIGESIPQNDLIEIRNLRNKAYTHAKIED